MRAPRTKERVGRTLIVKWMPCVLKENVWWAYVYTGENSTHT